MIMITRRTEMFTEEMQKELEACTASDTNLRMEEEKYELRDTDRKYV